MSNCMMIVRCLTFRVQYQYNEVFYYYIYYFYYFLYQPTVYDALLRRDEAAAYTNKQKQINKTT
jgi:hypothetical protein